MIHYPSKSPNFVCSTRVRSEYWALLLVMLMFYVMTRIDRDEYYFTWVWVTSYGIWIPSFVHKTGIINPLGSASQKAAIMGHGKKIKECLIVWILLMAFFFVGWFFDITWP